MSDIATRLRQTRANMIGSDDEQHYWDCHDAAAEIERLRLTNEEREAIELAIATWVCKPQLKATLRGLLERNGAVDGRETVR
jgi:hypothetical protein